MCAISVVRSHFFAGDVGVTPTSSGASGNSWLLCIAGSNRQFSSPVITNMCYTRLRHEFVIVLFVALTYISSTLIRH
jgi:TRAP-type mannitol/chloroaromatic compound transport system permease large subunit